MLRIVDSSCEACVLVETVVFASEIRKYYFLAFFHCFVQQYGQHRCYQVLILFLFLLIIVFIYLFVYLFIYLFIYLLSLIHI